MWKRPTRRKRNSSADNVRDSAGGATHPLKQTDLEPLNEKITFSLSTARSTAIAVERWSREISAKYFCEFNFFC
jgi:hypothetical protein